MTTLSKLIAEYRRRADDRAAPGGYLSDDEITAMFNEAEQEACIRGRLLIDDETVECCVITLAADQVEYQLDPRVLDVEHARIPGRTFPLQRSDYDEIAFRAARNLEIGRVGEPHRFALRDNSVGAFGKRLVLDHPPNTDMFTQLVLVVRRLPLADMLTPDLNAGPPVDPSPEINPQLHNRLVLWPLHLTFDGRDQDRGDGKRSENYEERFTAFFGARPDANVERKRLRHQPPIVRPDSTFAASGNSYFRRYRPRVDP